MPGYKAGGPIQSITNFVNHFGSEFEISIVTSNKDLGESEPYENIEFNKWVVNEKYRVIYLDQSHQNRKQYQRLIKEQQYDFVYFNSLFSLYFTLIPLWVAMRNKKKIVLAPRGMLGAGALNLKKTKKQLLLCALKLSGIPKKILWQATANSECNEIKKCFGHKTQVHLAANLSAKMPMRPFKKNKNAGELNLFFLSRIAEKKNLIAALQYLLEVNEMYKVRFTIIGPVDEIKYWNECKEIIKKLPKHINVKVIGAKPNHEIPEILKDEHFMLLPTFHENFGHVIMEAFQNACPVILSDQTPWSELEQNRLGWDIPLNKPADFISAIEKAASMDGETFDEWSLNSFSFAKEFSNNENIVTANRALFT